MPTLEECAAFLRERDGFLILTHVRPDGDTLGCGAALCHALRRLGKRAKLCPNPEITEHFLPFVSPYLGETAEGETVVSVDIAEPKLFPAGFAGTVELAIDHHPTNSGFAKRTLLWAEKAACGEIVLELIEALHGTLTAEEADLLYMAVSTDCGCFQYGNTNAPCHRAAAKLIDYGAHVGALNKALFRSSSPARLRLEGQIFSTMRTYHNDEISVVVVTRQMLRDCGATEDDTDDLANLAGRLRGNRITITVQEQADGLTHGSVRTDGSVNATQICARFGGGGHIRASGCTVDLSAQALAAGLLEAVEQALA